MKIKFNCDSKTKYIRTNYDVQVTDDNGNDISNEISSIVIRIEPDDVVYAECKFKVSEVSTNNGNEINVTSIASTAKECVSNQPI